MQQIKGGRGEQEQDSWSETCRENDWSSLLSLAYFRSPADYDSESDSPCGGRSGYVTSRSSTDTYSVHRSRTRTVSFSYNLGLVTRFVRQAGENRCYSENKKGPQISVMNGKWNDVRLRGIRDYQGHKRHRIHESLLAGLSTSVRVYLS